MTSDDIPSLLGCDSEGSTSICIINGKKLLFMIYDRPSGVILNEDASHVNGIRIISLLYGNNTIRDNFFKISLNIFA